MLVSLRNVKHKAGFFGLQIIFIFSKPLSYGLRPQGLVNLFFSTIIKAKLSASTSSGLMT